MKGKTKTYDYDKDSLTSVKIPTNLRNDIRALFKKMKINQGELIKELFKLILLRYKDGSLNATNGYITLNILRSPIQK